jgi:hypothetical protein
MQLTNRLNSTPMNVRNHAISPPSKMPDAEIIGSDGLVIRDSGLWVNDKLHYLNRYLKIFSVGMKNKWSGKLYYIDLFAGPGRCRIRETRKETDGSPLVALLGFEFAKYFFFEADSNCYEALVVLPSKTGHLI